MLTVVPVQSRVCPVALLREAQQSQDVVKLRYQRYPEYVPDHFQNLVVSFRVYNLLIPHFKNHP